jgi:SNF2 family DNA or RNA helicase
MIDPDHIYGIEIRPIDPVLQQPEKIKLALKAHQAAALHKAVLMETYGTATYFVEEPGYYIQDTYQRRTLTIDGSFKIQTNVGILADAPGHGKTLIALSIIAQTPTRAIYKRDDTVYSYGKHYAHFTAYCEKPILHNDDKYIHTTLVSVPRGPVYMQWLQAIREQTTLKVFAIDSLTTIKRFLPASNSSLAVIKEFFERYDIILVKNTALKTLVEFYTLPYRENPVIAFDRIILDEAHDIICKMPIFSFRFLWLISGTYQTLAARCYGTRFQMSYAIRDIGCEERFNLMLVKGERDFVLQSFNIPPPVEHTYLCALPRSLSAVQPFLHPSVQERLNANDITGAIAAMGGAGETEDEIVAIVTRDLERDIRNKEHEITYTESLEIAADQKATRLQTLRADLQKLQDKRQALLDRVTALEEKTCSICYDNYVNPILLPCTHVFCGQCLISWIQRGNSLSCPQCRLAIQSQQLIAIVKEKPQNGSSETSAPTVAPLVLSKEDTLIQLLNSKPEGKFLIFSRIDSGFWKLEQKLRENNIHYSEMKGHTSHMMRLLDDFREGRTRVILLNTYYAGSGIDISFATDVVLFHMMGLDRNQAIGRAQRQGRTEQLHIHNLCYPNEMQITQNTPPTTSTTA